MSIKILHTGDAHIDTDIHGSLNPETGLNRAWESHARALASAVGHALEQQADVFVHAGDAFKTGRPSQEAVLMFTETLLPLAKEGIPIVLIGGNHDLTQVPTSQRTVTTSVAARLAHYGEVHEVARQPELITTSSGIQVGCLPWLSKSSILAMMDLDRLSPEEGDKVVVDYALRAAEEMGSKADGTAPYILASHATVDDVRLDNVSKGHKRGSEVEIAHLFAEPVLPRKALEETDAAYVALSHIHARQRMGTKCYYAGAPDRITFTDADDPKSVNLVTLGDDNTLEKVDYLETDARAMHSIALADRDAEERLGALTEGALVRLVLPPEESTVPEDVRATIAEAGALIASTQTTPADRPRQSMVTLPEKIDPVAALDTWVAERKPDVDAKRLHDLAARMVEAE